MEFDNCFADTHDKETVSLTCLDKFTKKGKSKKLVETSEQMTKEQSIFPHNKMHGSAVGDKSNALFVCPDCGKTAKTKQALERHAAYHLDERPFPCEMCQQRFKNSDDRGKHYRRLRKDGKYEHACVSCHKHFKSDVLLKKHQVMFGCPAAPSDDLDPTDGQVDAEEIQEKYMAPPICSPESPEDIKPIKMFRCKCCESDFKSAKLLKSHYKHFHQDLKRQVCIQCGQTLSSRDSLNRHYSIFHQQEFPFPCSQCDQKFKIKESLYRHVKFVHTDGGYPCSVCHHVFSQPVNLKKHMLTHSSRKEHICEVCGKGFKWKQGLEKHSVVHVKRNRTLSDEGDTATLNDKIDVSADMTETSFSSSNLSSNYDEPANHSILEGHETFGKGSEFDRIVNVIQKHEEMFECEGHGKDGDTNVTIGGEPQIHSSNKEKARKSDLSASMVVEVFNGPLENEHLAEGLDHNVHTNNPTKTDVSKSPKIKEERNILVDSSKSMDGASFNGLTSLKDKMVTSKSTSQLDVSLHSYSKNDDEEDDRRHGQNLNDSSMEVVGSVNHSSADASRVDHIEGKYSSETNTFKNNVTIRGDMLMEVDELKEKQKYTGNGNDASPHNGNRVASIDSNRYNSTQLRGSNRDLQIETYENVSENEECMDTVETINEQVVYYNEKPVEKPHISKGIDMKKYQLCKQKSLDYSIVSKEDGSTRTINMIKESHANTLKIQATLSSNDSSGFSNSNLNNSSKKRTQDCQDISEDYRSTNDLKTNLRKKHFFRPSSLPFFMSTAEKEIGTSKTQAAEARENDEGQSITPSSQSAALLSPTNSRSMKNPFIIQNRCTKIPVDESAQETMSQTRDHNPALNLSLTKTTKQGQETNLKRPSSALSGKFSLIKHMLSLQNEDHFDKSLFENPLYNKPARIHDFKKMVEMHKISNDINMEEYDLSGKQNIPLHWLCFRNAKMKTDGHPQQNCTTHSDQPLRIRDLSKDCNGARSEKHDCTLSTPPQKGSFIQTTCRTSSVYQIQEGKSDNCPPAEKHKRIDRQESMVIYESQLHNKLEPEMEAENSGSDGDDVVTGHGSRANQKYSIKQRFTSQSKHHSGVAKQMLTSTINNVREVDHLSDVSPAQPFSAIGTSVNDFTSVANTYGIRTIPQCCKDNDLSTDVRLNVGVHQSGSNSGNKPLSLPSRPAVFDRSVSFSQGACEAVSESTLSLVPNPSRTRSLSSSDTNVYNNDFGRERYHPYRAMKMAVSHNKVTMEHDSQMCSSGIPRSSIFNNPLDMRHKKHAAGSRSFTAITEQHNTSITAGSVHNMLSGSHGSKQPLPITCCHDFEVSKDLASSICSSSQTVAEPLLAHNSGNIRNQIRDYIPGAQRFPSSLSDGTVFLSDSIHHNSSGHEDSAITNSKCFTSKPTNCLNRPNNSIGLAHNPFAQDGMTYDSQGVNSKLCSNFQRPHSGVYRGMDRLVQQVPNMYKNGLDFSMGSLVPNSSVSSAGHVGPALASTTGADVSLTGSY